jgi:spore germination protein KB
MQDNKKINAIQFGALALVGTLSYSFYFLPGILIENAKNDIWLVQFVTTIIGFFVILLYVSIANRFGDLNIFQFIEKCFGKIIGRIINTLIILGETFFASFQLFLFSELINIHILPLTPKFLILLLFLLVILYALNLGLEQISRANQILVSITTLFFFIGSLLLILKMNIDNIKPILADGFIPIIKSSYLATCITTSCLAGLLLIPPKNVIDKENYKKAYVIGYLIGSLQLFTSLFFIIAVFGLDLAAHFDSPAYELLRVIGIEGIIDRVDVFFLFHWMVAVFFFVSHILYGVVDGIRTCFISNIKYRKWINMAIITIVLFLSLLIFKNRTEANYFLINYGIIMQSVLYLLLPLIIYIVSLIRKIKG